MGLADQGAQAVDKTCTRAAAFQASAAKSGISVRDVYWTLGAMDGVLIFDAANDEAATAAMLALSSEGSVHTQTSRAFNATEMETILKNRPK